MKKNQLQHHVSYLERSAHSTVNKEIYGRVEQHESPCHKVDPVEEEAVDVLDPTLHAEDYHTHVGDLDSAGQNSERIANVSTQLDILDTT